MSHPVENDAPRYLQQEWAAVVSAQHTYLDALDALQATCEHRTILKHTTSDYLTIRVCEDCGYFEQVQWDSDYRYQDKRLLGRAYSVSWREHYHARPAVRECNLLAPRPIPPGVDDEVQP